MPECDNPLWPCAMTGAAACLAGFSGISVVIHGSSGCYYYPATLLHAPLHGTFILQNEVIFGSEDRLLEVIADLGHRGDRIAVITTCVPAIMGEDVKSMLADHDVILVDAPGFSGDAETGYAKALSLLGPAVDPENRGVNIGGACLLDPFSRGNVQEVCRLLRLADVPVGTVFCDDDLARVSRAAPFTLGTNGDYPCGIGEDLGTTLGFDALRSSFDRIADVFPNAACDHVIAEIDRQEESVVRVCDKFLRRFDPPAVAIFAGAAYAEFAAATLEKYLDAEICCIGLRNHGEIRHPAVYAGGIAAVREQIVGSDPSLVLGSSFERSVCGDRSFIGFTPPLRGEIRLAPRPLVGINGALSFMERVLNACMDKRRKSAME